MTFLSSRNTHKQVCQWIFIWQLKSVLCKEWEINQRLHPKDQQVRQESNVRHKIKTKGDEVKRKGICNWIAEENQSKSMERTGLSTAVLLQSLSLGSCSLFSQQKLPSLLHFLSFIFFCLMFLYFLSCLSVCKKFMKFSRFSTSSSFHFIPLLYL